MPIYKVHLYFQGNQVFEVEARDDEIAEEVAIDMLHEACAGIPMVVDDVAVFKSSDQYTAAEELYDREERNINEDDPREDR